MTPPSPYPLAFDDSAQARLAETVPLVGALVGKEPESWQAKSRADEELSEDLAADRLWRACADAIGAYYLSEELTEAEWAAWRTRLHALGTTEPARWRILVADPIDGSSEWHRTGWRHSPVTTAAMLLDVTVEPGTALATERVRATVVAAVVGDIWQERTYRLAGDRLAATKWDTHGPHTTLTVSSAKRGLTLDRAMVAAYFPTGPAVQYLAPLFDAVPYLHNNGGTPFALRVVDGCSPRSYSVAIEPKPVDFWEHIGLVLATFGGAAAARLDGTPLALNPFTKQTSVTAANEALLRECVEVLRPGCERHRVRHLYYWLDPSHPVELGKKL